MGSAALSGWTPTSPTTVTFSDVLRTRRTSACGWFAFPLSFSTMAVSISCSVRPSA